jgi:hypothetical protein
LIIDFCPVLKARISSADNWSQYFAKQKEDQGNADRQRQGKSGRKKHENEHRANSIGRQNHKSFKSHNIALQIAKKSQIFKTVLGKQVVEKLFGNQYLSQKKREKEGYPKKNITVVKMKIKKGSGKTKQHYRRYIEQLLEPKKLNSFTVLNKKTNETGKTFRI